MFSAIQFVNSCYGFVVDIASNPQHGESQVPDGHLVRRVRQLSRAQVDVVVTVVERVAQDADYEVQGGRSNEDCQDSASGS